MMTKEERKRLFLERCEWWFDGELEIEIDGFWHESEMLSPESICNYPERYRRKRSVRS